MMAIMPASDLLAPWGQAAAIILAIYLVLLILVGLVLIGALLFTFVWIRQKAELLQQLRPQITQMNRAFKAVQRGDPLPGRLADNRLASTVAQVPRMAENVAARTSSI